MTKLNELWDQPLDDGLLMKVRSWAKWAADPAVRVPPEPIDDKTRTDDALETEG